MVRPPRAWDRAQEQADGSRRELEITRRTDYAIRILLSLARTPDARPLSARELGRLQDVPYSFARSIVSELARAGFVVSRRGRGGGVTLARPAAAVTVLSIIESTEGDIGLGLCTHDPDYCHRVEGCAMHRVWMEAEAQLRAFLGERTIADLATGATLPRPARRSSPAAAGKEVTPVR